MLQPQSYETGNKLQKESWRNHKYVEIKQLAMNQQGNKRSNQKVEANENDNMTYQTIGCS